MLSYKSAHDKVKRLEPITRERRRHVERLVRRQGLAAHPQLSYDAKLTYVVAGLRCSEVGHISKAALSVAMIGAA